MWRWPLDVAALGTRPQPLLLAGLALPRLERFKRLVQGSYPLVQVISAFSHQYVLLPWSLDSESHLESLVLAYNDDRNAVVQAEEPFVLLTLGITVFTLEVRHS